VYYNRRQELNVDRDYTVNKLEIAPLLKVANLGLRAAGVLGMPYGRLDRESILAKAQEITGLTDFGGDRFLEPLRQLLVDVDAARATPVGEIACRQTCIASACNRLRIQDYVNRNPDVHDVPIKRPIFIVGFPRTGTTLLQNLLALEPGGRALNFWELYNPAPMHHDHEEDRRIRMKAAGSVLKAARFAAPELPIVHDTRPDTKEECWLLFSNTFMVMNMELSQGLSRFGDWLLRQDMHWAYEEYKRTLQVLAHWEPTGQFVLKCPEHMWFLDTLLDVFPDACIVWSHRDPLSCIGSYSSMISLSRRIWYGRIYHEYIGDHITKAFLGGVERAMAVRDRLGPDRFFDINFETLVADPAKAVRSIKNHFDLPHSDETDAAVVDWLAQPRQDKPGKHIYSAEQWGLVAEDIYERYAEYIERYNVKTG